jgi:hypothetical protein
MENKSPEFDFESGRQQLLLITNQFQEIVQRGEDLEKYISLLQQVKQFSSVVNDLSACCNRATVELSGKIENILEDYKRKAQDYERVRNGSDKKWADTVEKEEKREEMVQPAISILKRGDPIPRTPRIQTTSVPPYQDSKLRVDVVMVAKKEHALKYPGRLCYDQVDSRFYFALNGFVISASTHEFHYNMKTSHYKCVEDKRASLHNIVPSTSTYYVPDRSVSGPKKDSRTICNSNFLPASFDDANEPLASYFLRIGCRRTLDADIAMSDDKQIRQLHAHLSALVIPLLLCFTKKN